MVLLPPCESWGLNSACQPQWQVFILFCWIILLDQYVNFLLHLYVCMSTYVIVGGQKTAHEKSVLSYCVGPEDGTRAANAFIYWDNLVAPLWHFHILLSHISKTTETCLLVRFSSLYRVCAKLLCEISLYLVIFGLTFMIKHWKAHRTIHCIPASRKSPTKDKIAFFFFFWEGLSV